MPVSLKAQDDIALDTYGPEQADTVEILSTKMGRLIKNTIILPSQYFEDESSNVLYPVIYLLNGHGGGYSSWGLIRPDLDYIASELGAIIVCPDGENSWYWDSPINPSSQFETYVSTELVGYIDDNYRTIHTRSRVPSQDTAWVDMEACGWQCAIPTHSESAAA